MKTLRSISIFVGIFASAFFLTLEFAESETSTTIHPDLYRLYGVDCSPGPTSRLRQNETRDSCMERLSAQASGTTGALGPFCQTQDSAVSAAISTFNSSCAGSSLASGNQCVRAARCCVSAQNMSTDDDDDPTGCEGVVAGEGDPDEEDDAEDRPSRFDSITGGLLRAAGRPQRESSQTRSARRRYSTRSRQYSYCPQLAREHFQSTQEAADRADERAGTREDALDAAQEALQEAETKQLTDREAVEDQLQEIKTNHEDAVKAIQDDLGEKQRILGDEIAAIAGEITATQDELKSMVLIEQGHWDEFLLKSRELRSQCHSDALKAVSDIRKNNATLAANGRLTAGGFNAALRGSGLTDQNKGDALVERLRRSCMRDENYAANLKALEIKRDASLRALNLAREQKNALIQSKQSELTAKRNSAPEKVQKAMQDLQQLMQRNTEALQRLQQRAARQEQQNAMAIQRAREKVERLQRRATEARNRESELNRLVQLQEEHGATHTGDDAPATGSGAASGNSPSVVAGNLATAEGLAKSYAEANCCESDPGACRNQCHTVQEFLRQAGVTPNCPPAPTAQGPTEGSEADN